MLLRWTPSTRTWGSGAPRATWRRGACRSLRCGASAGSVSGARLAWPARGAPAAAGSAAPWLSRSEAMSDVSAAGCFCAAGLVQRDAAGGAHPPHRLPAPGRRPVSWGRGGLPVAACSACTPRRAATPAFLVPAALPPTRTHHPLALHPFSAACRACCAATCPRGTPWRPCTTGWPRGGWCTWTTTAPTRVGGAGCFLLVAARLWRLF